MKKAVMVGANMGYTHSGMKLNDGGCCILHNGQIIAIAEERITREKHAGGFLHGLEYCLEGMNIDKSDIDLVVISSCCESSDKIQPIIKGISPEKVMICPSHHLSHAYGAFMTSPFENSLIMVLDNEGNVLDTKEDLPFYSREMEHMSYYIGDSYGIHLLQRDSVPVNKIGIGDAYRYFTHYLGFPSYVYAGKTMGLASYGKIDAYSEVQLFQLVDGQIECFIPNNYQDSSEALRQFLSQHCKTSFPLPRNPLQDITQQHADLARLIQRELERILVEKVNWLVETTGIHNLCISGGVGLNSVANNEIWNHCKLNDIYILPACGDTGQCLGNAIYGYCKLYGHKQHFSINNAYLGKEYSTAEITSATKEYMKKHPEDNLQIFSSIQKKCQIIAQLLHSGSYVGHFNGKSEFGPRALGNRSILANPCSPDTKKDLNGTIKFREMFRPFAPVVKKDKASEWFDINTESPYMLLVANVLKPNEIPAVTHVDKTARVQTITSTQNAVLYNILDEFEKLSGVPILLNTSFNIAGEPIVETPMDALKCFEKTNLDALSIGPYLITKDVKKGKIEIDNYQRFVVSLGAAL